jgi:putative FmdB family regulatory protein
MPIYEYECTLCHSRFERRQGFNEEPVSICPKCQGNAQRVFHPVPILFKGSGFYSTDHGRGWAGTTGREKAEQDTKEPAKEPAKKESEVTASKGSTESKAEAKN